VCFAPARQPRRLVWLPGIWDNAYRHNCYSYNESGEPAHAVSTVRFFTVEQPEMRVFGFEVFLQSHSHAAGQWNNAIFLVLALVDINGFALKVDIGDLQVNHLLASQSGRINQCGKLAKMNDKCYPRMQV